MKLIGLLLIFVALLVVMIHPFLPGDYDAFGLQVALVFGFWSLLGTLTCIPALLWFFHSAKNRNEIITDEMLTKQKRYAKIYVWSFIIVSLPIILMTTLTVSRVLGIVLFIVLVFGARFVLKRISLFNSEHLPSFKTPLVLALLPISLLVFQFIIDKPLTDWSRNKAIANSQQLIDDIESHKTEHGSYPPTLNAVWKDYNPRVTGIEKYHYTFDGSSYNLYFEQPRFFLDRFGTREFVVYNPDGTHLMLSHTAWHMHWTRSQARATQGWYKANDTSIPYWKYFWFD